MNAQRVLSLSWVALAAGLVVSPAASQGIGPDSRTGAIVGIACRHDDSPLGKALLRLRDAEAGRLIAGDEADDEGRFSFQAVPPGSYLVEIVDAGGRVLATGQLLALRAGATVSTTVRLPRRERWADGFFTNAAASAIVSAASLGITAVGDGVQPASPRF